MFMLAAWPIKSDAAVATRTGPVVVLNIGSPSSEEVLMVKDRRPG